LAPQNIEDLTTEKVCERIERLTTEVMGFWMSANGWAPAEAASLLNRSMLEWQASLSASLKGWLGSSTDGDLILAWANLGALVEGQLRLFLSVYYKDYQADAAPIVVSGTVQQPDEAALEMLRQFFVRRIWCDGTDWNPYVQLVQQRRNAIHAFRTRELGTFDEWRECLRKHLAFIQDMNDRLPYPDEDYRPPDW
jgi:hypothetical protein